MTSLARRIALTMGESVVTSDSTYDASRRDLPPPTKEKPLQDGHNRAISVVSRQMPSDGV